MTGPSQPVDIGTAACNTPVRYSVEPGTIPVGGSYDVTATLRNRDGVAVGTERAWMEDDASYQGSILPTCGKRLVSGSYILDVKIVVADYYLDPVETRTGSVKVKLAVTRPAPTKLMLRKYAYGSRGWQWTGRLISAGRPVRGQRIDLWWDLPGWEDYDVPKRTNRQGSAHWVSNPDGGVGGIRFQLRFAGSSKYAPARSVVFNLAPR